MKVTFRQGLEIVGLIAGIVYAVVTVLEWNDLRNNFEADQRSWVKISFGWPTNISPQEIFTPIEFFSNSGKIPITSIRAEGAVEVVPVDKPPSFSLYGNHPGDMESALFPGDKDSGFPIKFVGPDTKQPRPFTAQELDSLRTGSAYVAVFGVVVYNDQFGVHWYRFCDWKNYSPATIHARSGPCVEWNLIGDGLKSAPYVHDPPHPQ